MSLLASLYRSHSLQAMKPALSASMLTQQLRASASRPMASLPFISSQLKNGTKKCISYDVLYFRNFTSSSRGAAQEARHKLMTFHSRQQPTSAGWPHSSFTSSNIAHQRGFLTPFLASRSYCTTTSAVTQTAQSNLPYYLGWGAASALYFGACYACGVAVGKLFWYIDKQLSPFPRLSQQEVNQLKQKDNPAVYNFASWDDLYEQLIDGRCPDEILLQVNAILDGTLESQGPAGLSLIFNMGVLQYLIWSGIQRITRFFFLPYFSIFTGFLAHHMWKQYYRIKPVMRTRLAQSKVTPAFPLVYKHRDADSLLSITAPASPSAALNMTSLSHAVPTLHAPVTKIIRVPGTTVAFY